MYDLVHPKHFSMKIFRRVCPLLFVQLKIKENHLGIFLEQNPKRKNKYVLL